MAKKKKHTAVKKRKVSNASTRPSNTQNTRQTNRDQMVGADVMFNTRESGAIAFFKKMISKHSNILIAEGILFMLLAILMIANPTKTLFIIIAMLGVIVTVFGVYYLVRVLANKNSDRSIVLDVIFSLINILLGIVLIIYPQLSFSVFITFLAIVFLVRGIYFLVMSIDLFRYDTSSGVIGIVVALLSILLFAFVIFYPIAAAYAATFYIAISLIVYGLTNFVLAYRARKIRQAL